MVLGLQSRMPNRWLQLLLAILSSQKLQQVQLQRVWPQLQLHALSVPSPKVHVQLQMALNVSSMDILQLKESVPSLQQSLEQWKQQHLSRQHLCSPKQQQQCQKERNMDLSLGLQDLCRQYPPILVDLLTELWSWLDFKP